MNEFEKFVKKRKYDVCPVCSMLMGKGCKHCMSTPEFVIPVEDLGETAWKEFERLTKESLKLWKMAWYHAGDTEDDFAFRKGRYSEASDLIIESRPYKRIAIACLGKKEINERSEKLRKKCFEDMKKEVNSNGVLLNKEKESKPKEAKKRG